MRNTKPANTEDKTAADARRATWIKAGAAVGIGSAAIVAALLYTRHQSKKKPGA
jgi:hypothetical protein